MKSTAAEKKAIKRRKTKSVRHKKSTKKRFEECHGTVMVDEDDGRFVLLCRGDCPNSGTCLRRRKINKEAKTTTYFCSCDETEPEKCHIVVIHHHDSGVMEPKCVGKCGDGQRCLLKKTRENIGGRMTYYYTCRCLSVF